MSPSRPGVSTVRYPGRSVATIGTPQAIASRSTIPKLSPPRAGEQKRSAEA